MRLANTKFWFEIYVKLQMSNEISQVQSVVTHFICHSCPEGSRTDQNIVLVVHSVIQVSTGFEI